MRTVWVRLGAPVTAGHVHAQPEVRCGERVWEGRGRSFVPSHRALLMCEDSHYPGDSRLLGLSLCSGILIFTLKQDSEHPTTVPPRPPTFPGCPFWPQLPNSLRKTVALSVTLAHVEPARSVSGLNLMGMALSCPRSLCITWRSRADGTTTPTECTRNTPAATRSRTWRTSSPTRPRPTTARSPTGWNPPTTWTSTPAYAGRPTGRSSIPAPPTPGSKPAEAPEQKKDFVSSSPTTKGPGTFICTNFGFLSVFVAKWVYVRVLEESSTERWQMARKKVCQRRKLKNVFSVFLFFFFSFILCFRRWNLAGGLFRAGLAVAWGDVRMCCSV